PKETIKEWWAARPMTYGTVHGETNYQTESGSTETIQFGSKKFYERVDTTFYSWHHPLHTESGFFSKIFPYDVYKGKRVLEIGCGMGTMAMNWAQHGARITAVDLNPVAVAQTASRFQLFKLDANFLQEDANFLSFKDETFDYIYSWGVLHHSPNLGQSIREVFRVLRSKGEFGIMLYNRKSFLYWHNILYLEGFLHGEFRFLNSLQLSSRYTDGAKHEGNPYTWPVTRQEMQRLFAPYCETLTIKVFGTDLDGVLDVILPKVHQYLPRFMKKALARRW